MHSPKDFKQNIILFIVQLKLNFIHPTRLLIRIEFIEIALAFREIPIIISLVFTLQLFPECGGFLLSRDGTKESHNPGIEFRIFQFKNRFAGKECFAFHDAAQTGIHLDSIWMQ